MTADLRWDAAGFNAHLRAIEERVDMVTRLAVAEGAALVQRKAQQNSSGRPGPNVRSGAHRAGIVVEGPTHLGPTWEARVGPTKVYSRALELGHPRWRSGVKFPYMEPAVESSRRQVAEVFLAAVARLHR